MAIFRSRIRQVKGVKWEFGMEDGWEPESNIENHLSIAQWMSILPLMRLVNGVRSFPYVENPKGKDFIIPGDWIVTDQDIRFLCSDDKLDILFERVATVRHSGYQGE